LPGWWDAAQGRWLEEPSHVGSSTGNVAWAALALVTAYEATGEARFAEGALRLMTWANGLSDLAPGLPGGFFGHEPEPVRLTWKSTEHNVDACAVFQRLGAIDASIAGEPWRAEAEGCRAFLLSMFDEGEGRFFTGTQPDGQTPAKSSSALDAQLWPLLAFPEGPQSWGRALAWAERHHAVGGGFDFDADRDGIWIEGTAQAALVYRARGDREGAKRLLALIDAHRAPGGLLFAADRDEITTGLAVGPQSQGADFRYRRLPHLAPTAWAALAELGFNPFTGRAVGND
jgi:hypothetical protein